MKSIALIAAAGITVTTLGAGGVAIAHATPAPPTTVAASSSARRTGAAHGNTARGAQNAHHLARRALHAQWVTRHGKAFVTHDAIRGRVTAIAPTSVTIKAKDGVSQTYAVTNDTQVRIRKDGKGSKPAAGTIAEVHVKDRVIAVGTGTSDFSARRILVRPGTPKTNASPQAG